MQHVTAFSRPETVPPAPAVARKPSLWILSSWRDLVLYVCTPLVILPVFILAQARWSAEDIYLFVAAFGAMGHHLPGMIRAYGDRALFQRFRWRFIFAPIFLVAVCVIFFLWDLKGIVLIAFIWGVWHGMMQTYGFCRIYDAKVGSFAALTRRTADVSTDRFLPNWILHGAKWVAVFVIPLGALWFREVHASRSQLERAASIAADLPAGARAHSNYATALQEAGRVDEAVEEFSTVLRLNPSSAKAHVNLAALLTGKGKLQEAQTHFEEALRIEPNNAEFRSGYAYLLEKLGRDEQAATECEAAVRLEPKSAPAWYSYSAFLEKHGKLKEAIAQYRRAVQVDPRFVDAHIDLGSALFVTGDLPEAKAHYLEASKLEPKLAQPHNYLGRVLMREGNVSQAIRQFEEALRLHSDFPEAEENLRIAKESGARSLLQSPE